MKTMGTYIASLYETSTEYLRHYMTVLSAIKFRHSKFEISENNLNFIDSW